MAVYRPAENPLIGPEDVKPSRSDFEVIGVFNPAVARYGDEVILLVRVAERPISGHPDLVLTGFYDVEKKDIVLKEFSRSDSKNDFSDPRFVITPTQRYLTSISHLRIARSKDGLNFQLEETPALAAANDHESFGIEDPRITLIDDTYCITYVAVSPFGITTALALTKDFQTFERCGIIFCPENKDVVIFPEKIGGKYYALHRPESLLFQKREMWIAESPDLRSWGNHRRLMGIRQGSWDDLKIGAGAAPFKTESGWLEIYHGASKDNRYCLGAMLLDIDEPGRVIARSEEPILQPQTDYECDGFYTNVVFTGGLLYEKEKLRIYYGTADTSIACAEVSLQEVLETLNL